VDARPIPCSRIISDRIATRGSRPAPLDRPSQTSGAEACGQHAQWRDQGGLGKPACRARDGDAYRPVMVWDPDLCKQASDLLLDRHGDLHPAIIIDGCEAPERLANYLPRACVN